MDELIEIRLEYGNKALNALLTASEIAEISSGMYILANHEC